MKKSSTSSSVYESITDSSSKVKQYQKETTTTEKGYIPVQVPTDSIAFSRWFSVLDTAGFVQVIESGGMVMETSVKPRVKDGKPDGFDISTKAKSKDKTVQAPVDKTTTTKEAGSEINQTAKKEVRIEKVITKQRQAFRLNGWGALVLIGVAALVLFLVYKEIKRWTLRKL